MSRKKQCQCFSSELEEKWKRETTKITEDKFKNFINSVLDSKDLSTQLSSVKKVQVDILAIRSENHVNTDSDHTDLIIVLNVLVQMHSVCEPRHPLQRTIASTITAVWQFKPLLIEAAILNTLNGLINTVGVANELIDYVQSLMEYYPPGGRVLHIALPQVINWLTLSFKEYWKSFLKSIEFQNLLFSLSKVLLNILHFCNRLLVALIQSCDSGSCDLDDIIITSSKSLTVRPSEIKWSNGRDTGQLVQQLKEIQILTDNILKETSIQISRDTRISVAMVSIVVIATLSPSLQPVLPPLAKKWLTEGDYCYPPLSRLALVHGLLAKLSGKDLLCIKMEEKDERGGGDRSQPFLLWLFPVLTGLMKDLTDSSDRYVAARTLSHWSTVLSSEVLTFINISDTDLSPDGTLISKLMEYIWTHWEEPIDVIRHQCRLIFENLVSIYVKLKEKDAKFERYLQSLCSTLLSLSSPSRGKYSLLSAVSPHVSASLLLSLSPSLPAELMGTMGQQSLACKAGELWSLLIKSHFVQTEPENWKKVWLYPLINTLLIGGSLAKEHVKQYCIGSVFLATPTALRLVNEAIEEVSRDVSCDQTDSISLAFRVICESKSMTSLPPVYQLQVLLETLQYHMNSQSLSLREQVLAGL
ncbi:PREDICTED: thyroid adenoma-associated protein homolog [Amphimedon queenslandica]|uniref:Uncharacterized protein n=1 Tax=Amphimedon queenslandica TaxID=400682 RepID=A0AAN0JC71_AMPQE|nr:PREDICTED: thyroid adenoma-associated protein homolog [Amphimedon queenslandica]|eukprot:XP_019854367.1 PREDICTED: thyroid adenoma-associated protein homolog [Amphimedon queenslandica]